jgi:hypothetical protein
MTPKARNTPTATAPSGTLVASLERDGKPVGTLVLTGKVFTTGNVGFFGTGKLVVDGQRYQGQAQLAAIREK